MPQTEDGERLVVRRASEVALSLTAPKHGWLGFRLRLGDYVLDEPASGVLNDPIEELIDLAMFAARNASGMRRVCVWCEPAGFAIDAWQCGEETVQVRVGEDPGFIPPMAGRALEEVSRWLVDRGALIRCVERAVSGLISERDTAFVKWGWKDAETYRRLLDEVRIEVQRQRR